LLGPRNRSGPRGCPRDGPRQPSGPGSAGGIRGACRAWAFYASVGRLLASVPRLLRGRGRLGRGADRKTAENQRLGSEWPGEMPSKWTRRLRPSHLPLTCKHLLVNTSTQKLSDNTFRRHVEPDCASCRRVSTWRKLAYRGRMGDILADRLTAFLDGVLSGSPFANVSLVIPFGTSKGTKKHIQSAAALFATAKPVWPARAVFICCQSSWLGVWRTVRKKG